MVPVFLSAKTLPFRKLVRMLFFQAHRRPRVRGFHLALKLVYLSILLAGCSEKVNQDPCCSWSDLHGNSSAADGQGLVKVEGSTAAFYYVFDENGKQIANQKLNESLALDPGNYHVSVNNTMHAVSVEEDMLTSCSTGTLLISGHTLDSYYVTDSAGHHLAHERLGKAMSFFPGAVRIKVNNTEMGAEIKLKELTEIRTGSLNVRGNTGEYYYVLDASSKQLNYNILEKPLAFFPGKYLLKVNNTSLQTEVLAGQVTEIATGNVLVKGLTEEYYYVTDTLENALNYQTLNKPLAFFPGVLHVKVNNTLVRGRVLAGQTTEFVTGSLLLTGTGTEYYYVLDEAGKQLNYNTLNRSLSLFPSEYTVRLGPNYRKATVLAGQVTSIKAYY